MKMISNAKRRQQRIRFRIRRQAKGRLRLSVHRSGSHIYAQIIDDNQGITLVSASTLDKDLRVKAKNGATVDAAKAVGLLIGQRAKEKKLVDVVFDRGSFLYHGRVKALADGAREAGLNF